MPGPRAGTILLWIAGIMLVALVAVVVTGSFFGLFVASHIHVHHQQHGNSQQVDIRSPFGELKVQSGHNSAVPGIPIFPGATRLPPGQPSAFQHGVNDEGVNVDGKHSHDAHVHIQVAGKEIDVDAAEYLAGAPVSKVQSWYRQALANWGTVEVKIDDSGQIELKVKEGKDNRRIVVIRRDDQGRTHFMLVHVAVGEGPV